MTANVSPRRIVAAQGGVAIAASVRSVHWVDAARLWNWASGRGSMDVPAHVPGSLISPSEFATFTYRTSPRYQTTRHLLTLLLSSEGVPGVAQVTVPSGATTYDVPYMTRELARPWSIVIDRASQSTSEDELSFDIEVNVAEDDACRIECVSIEALPRLVLVASDDDLGVDPEIVRPRNPIAETSLHDQLAARGDLLAAASRRVGMLQVARGSSDPWTFNSGTFADFFSSDHPLLGRSLTSGDDVTAMSWAVLAKCSDGTTAGEVVVDNVSVGTGLDTITIPAGTTSWTWLPQDSGFDCDAEDNSTSTGLRSATWDDHKFKCRRTAGTGTISIATLSVWEP